jgi:hypothetical protein
MSFYVEKVRLQLSFDGIDVRLTIDKYDFQLHLYLVKTVPSVIWNVLTWLREKEVADHTILVLV